MDLLLYKIGQDETTRFNIRKKLEGIDSILVVRIKIAYEFFVPPGWPAADMPPAWGPAADHRLFIQKLEKVATKLNGDPFGRLPIMLIERAGPPNPDPTKPGFERTYIYFRPCYAVGNTLVTLGRHFLFRARRQSPNPAKNSPDIYNMAYNAPTVTIVENETNMNSLLRYCLGLPAVLPDQGGVMQPQSIISPGDLTFLSNWMVTKCGGIYGVRSK